MINSSTMLSKKYEIVETPLVKRDDLRKKYSLGGFYIKDESANPFGTIKDRRSAVLVSEADKLKVDKLVLITSGNNGYSLANFASGCHIQVVSVVSKNVSDSIKRSLSAVSHNVIEVNLEHKTLRPEELITFAREKEDEVIWEVTNGYEDYYATIVDEIFKKIKPDYIVVPVGSGGIFIGITQALEARNLVTRVIGVGVESNFVSFADKLSTPWTPYAKALEHYQNYGHYLYRLTESDVRKSYQSFKHVTSCEPSSAVVFGVLYKHKFKSTDIVVFLNSGKSKI